MGANRDNRDGILASIYGQLKLLRSNISAAGIGDLDDGYIIIGDSTATNQVMPLIDQIDFQIEDIEDGKEYVLVANNFQKGEVDNVHMFLDADTADVTIKNNGGAMGAVNPAAVTDTEQTFTITSGADFVVNANMIITITNITGSASILYGSMKIKVKA